jgi:hypothetical protein
VALVHASGDGVKMVGVPITPQEEAEEEGELRLLESKSLGASDGEGGGEGLHGERVRTEASRKGETLTNLHRYQPRNTKPRQGFSKAHFIRRKRVRPDSHVVRVDEDESVDLRFTQRCRSEELEVCVALSFVHRPHLRFDDGLAQSHALNGRGMELRKGRR